MSIETSYTAELRRRIQDVRPSRRALTFALTDEAVTKCIAEITNGRFVVTPFGGTAAKIDWNLSNERYATVGQLYQALSRAQGYTAQMDEDADQDHSTLDIMTYGPTDMTGTGIQLVHHVFSDSELEDIIRTAMGRHNPSFTQATMPPQEWAFVLPLALAEVHKQQAGDASKRRGTAADVATLLALVRTYEDQYAADTERLARAIQSPREANANLIDEGDIMLASLSRQNMRTGYTAPIAKTLSPDAAVLLEPNARDVEDDNIRLVWQRNKNVDTYSYELWMDSTPEVVRGRIDELTGGRHPNFIEPRQLDEFRDVARRTTTSRAVFSSYGGNTNMRTARYSSRVDEVGQLTRMFAVGGLESETTYYFRLFIISLNHVMVSSNVVSATTKKLRCRFSREPDGHPTPTRGAPNTVLTLYFDENRAEFTEAHRLRIGEKEVTPITMAPYKVTVAVPRFENLGHKDIAVISPTGLLSVLQQSFEVTR